MRRLAFVTVCRVLLLVLPLLAGGCDVEGDLSPCTWNVRVTYSYAPFGSQIPFKEVLRDLHEYLFDEQGILVGVNLGTKCKAEETDYQLPVGSYTLVAWGNINGNTTPPPCEVGRSTIEELQMQAVSDGMSDLMYAAIPFRVVEGGQHRLKAALTDAYATLYVNVHWQDDNAQPLAQRWQMELTETPGIYSFSPGMQLQAFGENTAQFLPQMLPTTISYEVTPAVANNTVTGVFKTYRVSSQSSLILCLYADGVPVRC